MLHDYISKTNDVVLLRDPGGVEVSEKIRDILLSSEMDLWTEILLFLASRNELLNTKILPALEEGKIVILDRFVDSTIAYQGYGKMLGLLGIRGIRSIMNLCFKGIPLKNVHSILIDIDVDLAMSRVGNNKDRFESLDVEFYNRVRQGYLTLKDTYSLIVDGALPSEDIHKMIVDKLFYK
jgi:dTMP kinase